MKTNAHLKNDIITGFIPGVHPAAAVIKGKLDSALNYNPNDLKNITIDIAEDKVTLGGIVDNVGKMRYAMYAAWEAPGVNRVENNIKVLDNLLI